MADITDRLVMVDITPKEEPKLDLDSEEKDDFPEKHSIEEKTLFVLKSIEKQLRFLVFMEAENQRKFERIEKLLEKMKPRDY